MSQSTDWTENANPLRRMGKTIQIIALLVTDGRKPNLVVAPTVAVMQWRNEIEAHTDGLKVLVWHGSGRETSAKTLASYDVVRTPTCYFSWRMLMFSRF